MQSRIIFAAAILMFLDQAIGTVGKLQVTGFTQKRRSCEHQGKCETRVIRVVCGDPGNLPRGTREVLTSNGREFNPGHQIRYSCNKGFFPVGDTTIECQNDGYWSNLPPFCMNDNFIGTWQKRIFNKGENVTIKCEVKVKGTPECVKSKDGFSVKFPISQNRCPDIPSLLNGFSSRAPVGGHSPGNTATFKCKLGFELVGAGIITCQPSGQWNQPVPSCVSSKHASQAIDFREANR